MKTTIPFLTVSAFLLFVAGCQAPNPTSRASSSNMTNQAGTYSPPPAGLNRVRVGVPPFAVDERQGSVQGMNIVAADQATTLLMNTQRFRVIERAQLEQLTKEQGLEGIVKWDEMARMGEIRGVDYLLLGRVTNFRVLASQSSGGFGLGGIPVPFAGVISGFNYQDRKSQIRVECGIDLRLVNPTTGEVVAAQFSEYDRVDSIGSFNVSILGVSSGGGADLQINEGDQGRILRLAIDSAIYRMLPAVDAYLLSRPVTAE